MNKRCKQHPKTGTSLATLIKQTEWTVHYLLDGLWPIRLDWRCFGDVLEVGTQITGCYCCTLAVITSEWVGMILGAVEYVCEWRSPNDWYVTQGLLASRIDKTSRYLCDAHDAAKDDRNKDNYSLSSSYFSPWRRKLLLITASQKIMIPMSFWGHGSVHSFECGLWGFFHRPLHTHPPFG